MFWSLLLLVLRQSSCFVSLLSFFGCPGLNLALHPYYFSLCSLANFVLCCYLVAARFELFVPIYRSKWFLVCVLSTLILVPGVACFLASLISRIVTSCWCSPEIHSRLKPEVLALTLHPLCGQHQYLILSKTQDSPQFLNVLHLGIKSL